MTEDRRDALVVVRDPGTFWRAVLDGLLVLTLDMDEPIEISSPGDAVWRLLAEPMAIDDLVHTLAAEFGEDASAIRRDVEKLVQELLALGAVRIAD